MEIFLNVAAVRDGLKLATAAIESGDTRELQRILIPMLEAVCSYNGDQKCRIIQRYL